MDDHRDDFEEKMEEDEVEALDEEELLLGLGEEDDPLEDDSDEKNLDKFGFHHDDEEATDF